MARMFANNLSYIMIKLQETTGERDRHHCQIERTFLEDNVK